MFTGGAGELPEEVITFNPSYFPSGDVWYVLVVIFAVVLVFVFVVCSLISYSFNYNKKKKKPIFEKAIDADFQSSDLFDVYFHKQHTSHNYDYVYENENVLLEEADHDDDAKYSEELQVQEAIFASMLNNNPSSSSSSFTRIPTSSSSSSSSPLSSILFNNNRDDVIQVCNICLENQENWKMFVNPTCPHSFCYECITKYAATKIQEKNNPVTCPEFNCNSTLDSPLLRLIIPRQIMIKWDALQCESTILETHKLYCPFANCAALLINDDVSISKVDCPVCQRSICAACRVPWHSEFTCKEFGKLNSKKWGGKDEKMTKALAKKKKWKKCPKCKFFVEKSEGCLHITCRCMYEFCYRCGAKWTNNHGGCRMRSVFFRG